MFWDRFVSDCERIGKRPNAVAKEIPVSSGILTKWKNGGTPSTPLLYKIANYFEVSADYLLGKTDYRDVSLSVGQILPFEPRLGARPILGDVCAGVGVIAQQSIIGWQTVDTRFDREDCFWLRVKGDSMEPIINENDLILVDKAAQMENGSIGVFLIDRGEGVIKRVKWENDTLTLIPENDAYEPMSYSGKNLSRVYYVGRVVKQERDWT